MRRSLRRYAALMGVARRPERHVVATAHLAALDAHEGKWVAVRGGQVVAVADTSVALAEKLRTTGTRGAVMQYVPPVAHTFTVGVG